MNNLVCYMEVFTQKREKETIKTLTGPQIFIFAFLI